MSAEPTPVWPDAAKLLAAASSFANAAGDCCDAARDDPGALAGANVADGDTLTIALDAVRLLMEATGDPAGDLYAAICRHLETTP